MEEYAAEIALAQEQGRTTIESVALGPHGAVVAWTGLVVAPTLPARHRSRGRWSWRSTADTVSGEPSRSRRCTPPASTVARSRVRTSSDDENVWMRRINADLGFVPVESEVLVHRRR